MNNSLTKISAVQTNIITGFLGVGKTSAILHLLANKPPAEKWAVLVNEFGEIGIDGHVISGQGTEEQGVFIREVPGGCMCCAAGIPMQIALNQLLKQAKPDRLLIEPTGLGHPKEVMQVLMAPHYEDVLQLQQTITLVDARNLTDQRYTKHDTFNQQVAIADVIVGNKEDLYKTNDKKALNEYVKTHCKPNIEIIYANQGRFPLSYLQGETAYKTPIAYHHHHSHQQKTLANDIELPECGYIKAINNGEGYQSIGWRFASDKVFDQQKTSAFLTSIDAQRIKAVLKTNVGTVSYNVTQEGVSLNKMAECTESRIEIIATTLDESWEPKLLACLVI